MIRSHDLRESFGLGGVGFVAAGADYCGVELGWFHGRRIVGMLDLRSVAGFARDHHMPALLFLIDHVGMADLARIVARKGDGPTRDLADSSAAIVSILAKTLRDDERTQRDECDQCNRHDCREPDEMFSILKQAVRLRSGRESRNISAMLLDT